MRKMFGKFKTLLSAAAAAALLPCMTVSADEKLVFSLAENAAVRVDGTVSVSVTAEENPGVQSWVLVLGYDSGAVGFSGIEDGVFGRLTVSDDKSGTVTVNCFGSGDISADGTAFTALFVPKAGAESFEFTLAVSEDEGDFFNFAGEDVACSVSRGRLTVTLDRAESSDKAAVPSDEKPPAAEEIKLENTEPQEETVSADSAETDSAAESPKETAVSESSADTSAEETVSAPPAFDEESAEALPQTEKQNTAASEPPSDSDTAERPSETGSASPLTAFVLALIAAGTAVASRRR